MSVNVSVVDGNSVISTQGLARGAGKTSRIKAVKGGKYILAEGQQGFAPENITVKRVGKNLHVALEGTDPDQPELVIEDFYLYESQLVGMAEDSVYHEYVAVDGEDEGAVAVLIDGASSAQALGSSAATAFAGGPSTIFGSAIPVSALGLGALGLAGAGIAVGGSDSGSKKRGSSAKPEVPAVPDAPVVGGVYDDQGAVQGNLASGDVTDDQQPTLSGRAQPGVTVIIKDNGVEIGRAPVDAQGNWSFTPDAPLAEGKHNLTVLAVDAAGNQSEPSEAWMLEVDTTAPLKPGADGNGLGLGEIIDDVGAIQGPIGQGEATDDSKPTFNGKGEPGGSVIITDHGVEIGRAPVDAQGNWSFTPEQPLAEGEHSIQVIVVDAAGNQSEPSDAWGFVVDTVAPEKGVVEGVIDGEGNPIAPGESTSEEKPTLSGSGEPGGNVTIIDNGHVIGEVEIDENGHWEFTPEEPLGEGEHEIEVIITDPAGNESEPSDPWVIVVDGNALDAPSINGVYDDQGAVTGNLASGAVTDDQQPTLSGQAEPNSTVIIKDNGAEIGSASVDAQGNWSFTPELPLAEGMHSLTAEAVDANGNQSEPSEVWVLEIDITIPERPGTDGEGLGLSEVIDDVGAIQGPIGKGQATDDGKPTFNGKGEPGGSVILTDHDVEIGRVPVDAQGNWSFTPEQPLAEGEHSIQVIVVDAAGNQSEPSDAWDFVVDTVAPEKGVVEGVVDGEGNPIAPGESTSEEKPTLSGSGEPGGNVTIIDNGQVIGEVEIDENGHWEFTPEEPLGEGEHEIEVIITDPAGNESEPSDPWVIVVDPASPSRPEIEGVVDSEGSPIAPGESTSEEKPTLSGSGEPGGSVTVTDNGNVIGEVEVDENGHWEFTPEAPLGEGEHVIEVIITDPAGSTSEPSDPWVIVVDTTAPEQGEIEGAVDSGGNAIAPGESTSEEKPTLSGSGEPGGNVIIIDNGNVIGEVEIDENGHWEFTPEEPLGEGEHEIEVIITDPAGNESEPSAPWLIVVDTTAPDVPSIGGVYDDQGDEQGNLSSGDATDDQQPTLSGQAEPNSTVIIKDNGVEIGRAPVDAQGNWSFTPPTPLEVGAHQLSAQAVDAAGNHSSADSQPFVLVIYMEDAPGQFTSPSLIGKDSGRDGHDHVTNNGKTGRLMQGELSAELNPGERLEVSTDRGLTWTTAFVDGLNWAAQDQNSHSSSWTIQTRVVDQLGYAGPVMTTDVTLDALAQEAPTSIQLSAGTLQVAFDASDLVVGDRISIIADEGAKRFEHTLTAADLAVGKVSLEVGAISSASAALVDRAGNVSEFVNTGDLAPGMTFTLTGDVAEIYGQRYDNYFNIDDVSVLDQIRLIEGNGGVDTLVLTGAEQLLDLSAWQGRLSSIEVIDITGSGNNTLKLSLGDVLELGNAGAFIADESVQLAIKGNAGDVLKLDDLLPNGMDVGDWESLGEAIAEGVTYEVYHHTELAAEILVQQGITVELL